MAAEPGQAPVAPPGQGGSGGAQIMQDIQQKLAQLAQAEPEPEIQQAVAKMSQEAEALETVLGKDDAQDMQSGLANPGAPGGEAAGGMPGGAPAPGGAAPAEELPAGGGAAPEGGGDHHGVAEIHIKMQPGGPKTFGAAKKAAMATHAERGHFDKNTPKGETPSSQRSKSKAKG